MLTEAIEKLRRVAQRPDKNSHGEDEFVGLDMYVGDARALLAAVERWQALEKAADEAATTLEWASGCGGICESGQKTILPQECAKVAEVVRAALREKPEEVEE